MAEQECPLCKSDAYLNPNIKILISPCFHRLCEQCVYRLFSHGYAPCPECQTPLRRINFITSTFEDVEIEREIRMRKLLTAHFARKREEFASIQDFNDYLEEFENLVFAMLAVKSDALVKERIAEIKAAPSVLNPAVAQSKSAHDSAGDEPPRKRRAADDLWRCMQLLLPQRPPISSDVHIMPGMLAPSLSAGLGKSVVVGFIIESLFSN
ncbi:CDK-activating kinase assembly factor MAT1 [Pancytospora philotis]|nr:CDK-activating kinase assembly factor MAT1 [Pancytospora philotis]